MAETEMQLFQVSIKGTELVTLLTFKEMDDLLDPLGEFRKRGMEHISAPARRNLLRTAFKADRLFIEDLNSETG